MDAGSRTARARASPLYEVHELSGMACEIVTAIQMPD